MEAPIDIIENTIRRHGDLLNILLTDQTKKSDKRLSKINIIWATDSYSGHKSTDEMKVENITGSDYRRFLIQPRIAKSKEEQKHRTRDKAEVFTPTEIVEQMNKQIDLASGNWPANENNWKNYVKELRLEITCGEAPFIVGRYNAANGRKVRKPSDRIGFLDRKLQVVSKYCNTKKEWLEWATIAFQCSYGYEWQGDNLLLARENLLYTFIDFWNDKFPKDRINLERKVSKEKLEILKNIATIISWNIFQMDGLKYIIPMSGVTEVPENEIVPPMLVLLGTEQPKPTPKKATYVKIKDWETGEEVKFIDLLK